MNVTDGSGLISQSDMSGSPDEIYRRIAAAHGVGRYEQVRHAIQQLPSAVRNQPRFQQMLGLAHRGLLDSEQAHTAFSNAARQIPSDPLLAHSVARSAMEAGFPSIGAFDHARKLAPADAGVILGRAAAQLAERKAEAACSDLAAILSGNPGWIEGHLTFARIKALFEPGGATLSTIRAALRAAPRDEALWQALIHVHLAAYDYADAAALIPEIIDTVADPAKFLAIEASCLSEIGEFNRAQAIFDQLPIPTQGETAIPVIRNLIRLGRYEHALQLANIDYPAPGMRDVWPYRALLWRLLGLPQWSWMEGDERLIRTYDLNRDLNDGATSLGVIADCLRALHRGSHQPLEQSVRGGTQTDGMLFARAEPEIRHLRSIILAAVEDYVSQLPAAIAGHPTLCDVRAPLRFEGAWSVRLTGGGFHADHVHPHGWISSAFYLALPEAIHADDEAGWLTFGENRALLPDLKAFRTVQPRPGELTLFPSTMWHGTRPFSAGERLTVAFDVAIPRGL